MKRIIALLCMACLAWACTDDKVAEQTFDSVLTPYFSFDDSSEIIANVDAVQFIDESRAEGTQIDGYFWHFGFAGLGNWSEKAVPDPVVYKDAGEYTVTLTVYGADGNRCSTTRTIVIKAANMAPTASFTYAPEAVSVDTEVTFTDTSVDSDGEIVSREWLLPDGTTPTDVSVGYTFTKGGTFGVTLRVTDDRGASSEITKSIYVAGGESSGSGTAADPWVIATADRWNEIAASINGSGEFSTDDYYMLAGDIDFTGKTFVAWKNLRGQLDGNSRRLMGITANNQVAAADINNDAGAFGVICVNDGTVKNITVEAKFVSTGHRLGGIVGKNNGIIDGAYFKGDLSGDKRVGGIAGENNKIIVNCANLGGAVRGSDLNQDGSVENCGGLVGGNTNSNAFVINCYCWADSVVLDGGNNSGGLIGYGGSDSFTVNCYSTVAVVTGGNTCIGAVGYIKKSNLQNIYNNAALATVVGSTKNTGNNAPSVWAVPTTQSLTLAQMMSGAVTVPSSGQQKESFVEALNAGVDIFNTATYDQKPAGVVLRRWTGSNTYPVLAD